LESKSNTLIHILLTEMSSVSLKIQLVKTLASWYVFRIYF